MNRTKTVVRATWNWLWGKPIEAGGEIAAQVSEDSIDDLTQAFQTLVDSVGLQRGALAEALRLHDETEQQVNTLSEQADQLVAAGEDDAALAVLAELDVLEEYRPQLEEQVLFAKQTLAEGTTRMKEAQLELRKMQAQQKMGASTMRVTQALERANQAAGIDNQSAMRRFEKSQEAIKRRNIQAQATSEVQGELKGTSRAIKTLHAQDRLAQLKAKQATNIAESKDQ
ncbi:PspA/IM30 family protein [Acaryochloris marina NIES-2412]|uniref:PspA/IM30 family protein n=1 Tax=Acaryochloris marina TaxID=155978 RepID=UPI004059F2CE